MKPSGLVLKVCNLLLSKTQRVHVPNNSVPLKGVYRDI